MRPLAIEHLSKAFGGVRAVADVSFAIEPGEVKALIGPNGAGKTTCFNLVTGVYAPDAGTVRYGDREITALLPDQVARLGVARTFQHPRLFRQMTVLENVVVGYHRHIRAGFVATALRLPSARREQAMAREIALTSLERVGLERLAEGRADALSTGQEKLLELARALAAQPDLLLLDEPAAGLNDQETEFLAELIGQFKREGLSILVVEHNMDLVMSVSDSMAVLDHGEKIAEGTPYEIQNNPAVLEAYLGARNVDEVPSPESRMSLTRDSGLERSDAPG